MEKLDLQLRKVLKSERIITRVSGSSGIWLSFLLPTAVLVSCLNPPNNSDDYKLCAIYSFNIILNVFYLLFHIYFFSSMNMAKKINVLYGVPMSVVIYLYFYILNMDVKRIFCYTISNGLIYFEGVLFFLKVFPNSFTFGEVNIAVQGLSLFIFNAFVLLSKISVSGIPKNEFDTSLVIIILGLFWVLVFCTLLYIFKQIRTIKLFYLLGLSTATMIYWSIFYFLNVNFFYWVWLYFTKPDRITILFLWLLCSFLAVATVQYHIQTSKKSNTMIRKYFHGVIVVVYMTGVFTDLKLLYFSSGCIFGLFIVLEAFRILNIPPLNSFLTSGFLIYCDEKDSNNLALTPICLLVGHSLPIWLNPFANYSQGKYLLLLSGVLSVGIGDTFASIGGKLFGRHKYKNSIKSIEGTICCILSQVLSIQLLIYFDYLHLSLGAFAKSFISIFITSIVEAKTDQIDNIVLPLVMYILLML